MSEERQLMKLRGKIDQKRLALNNLIKGDLSEEKVIKLSKELDVLIKEYYDMEFKNSRK